MTTSNTQTALSGAQIRTCGNCLYYDPNGYNNSPPPICRYNPPNGNNWSVVAITDWCGHHEILQPAPAQNTFQQAPVIVRGGVSKP